MSRILRAIAEFANFFHGVFGSSIQRPFSRQAIEDRIGPMWTRVVMSIPAVTVTLWLVLWAASRLLDMPEGEDPFSWIRKGFGN